MEDVELHLHLASAPITDTWLVPSEIDGYEFVPLRTVGEIAAEAEAMKNCLRTYGDRLARGVCRLWSIRRAGSRVANLEVRRGPGAHVPSLCQMRGQENKRPPDETWVAALRWIGKQDQLTLNSDAVGLRQYQLARDHWTAFWRPFWLAKGRIPTWLPLAPSTKVIWDL